MTEHIGGHRLEVFQINGKFKLTFDFDQPIPADLLARTPGILLASPLIVSKWKKKIPRVPLCWCSILITAECKIKQSPKAVVSSSSSSNNNINNSNISNYKLNNNINGINNNNLSSYLRNNNFNTLNNNNSCSSNNNSSSSNSNNTNSSFTKTSNPRNSKLPHNQ